MPKAMIRISRVLAACLAIAVLMAACGGSEDPGASSAGGSGSENETADEAGENEVASTAPTATCDDSSNDAEATIYGEEPFSDTKPFRGRVPGHADVRSIELALEENSLSLRYELGAAVPADEKDPKAFPFTRLGFDVYTKGRHAYSIFAVAEDGATPAGRETIKPGAQPQTKELKFPDGTVTLQGTEVVATVPLADLPALEGDFSWAGYLVAGQGEETFSGDNLATAYDSCPDLTQQEEGALASEKIPASLLKKLPTQP